MRLLENGAVSAQSAKLAISYLCKFGSFPFTGTRCDIILSMLGKLHMMRGYLQYHIRIVQTFLDLCFQ